MIALRSAMFAKAGSSEPEYLSFISSDGSAWIDTGYTPAIWDTFEIEMSAVNWTGSALTWKTSFFGCTPSSSNQIVNSTNSYVFAPIAPDRQFAVTPPKGAYGGGNCRYWNANANEGNEFLDGQFHTFILNQLENQNPTSITVDGTGTIPMTLAGWTSGTVGDVVASVSIFGCHTENDTCIGKTSPDSQFRFRRLKFFDRTGTLMADFRAANVGGELGVFDDVSRTFSTARDGSLSGE